MSLIGRLLNRASAPGVPASVNTKRLVTAANDASATARADRTQAVANEFDATNKDMPHGERKRIAWERAQRKNPELFGKSAD